MAELRLDPMTHRWVVTGKLPIMPDVIDRVVVCPFCPGNEDLTPKAIGQILGPDGKWNVRVFHDRARVSFELGLQRLAESNRFRRDHMHQRAALETREDRRVDFLPELGIARKDHATARTAKRLVRGGGRDMGMVERIGMNAARHQPREMRHVDHEVRADGIRDCPEAREIDDAATFRRPLAFGKDHRVLRSAFH